MQRGPIALFGAIVAVGLGPAMWLGAQFGNVADLPSSPPAVRSEHSPQNLDQGGAAGAAPEDPTVVLETKPRTNKGQDVPRSHPSASATSSKPRTPSPSATPSPSDDASIPATEPPPSPPDTESGGGDGGSNGSVQPSPPTDSGPVSGGDPQQPTV